VLKTIYPILPALFLLLSLPQAKAGITSPTDNALKKSFAEQHQTLNTANEEYQGFT